MLENSEFLSAALPWAVRTSLLDHVLRSDGQEDLCFAIWYPSQGQRRLTALIGEPILPGPDERIVRGNVSFTTDYFLRALRYAAGKSAGLCLLHSHLGPGWQDLSEDDFRAEASQAGAALAATNYPLLGLTAGRDGNLSGRFWRHVGPHEYEPAWCESVRAVGERLVLTHHPLKVHSQRGSRGRLDRTIGVWGEAGQAQLANLRIAIVGLGSVGSIICEALARMGVAQLSLIDYDKVKMVNLDRTLNATADDVGRSKVGVARDHALLSATALNGTITAFRTSVVERDGYRAALDCDLIFSCVDRPWPRRVLNHIAYAHLIPVVDGGIAVRHRGSKLVGADWQAHTVAPGRRCLECVEAFDPSLVGVERDGWLEDPTYIQQLDTGHVLKQRENVLPFSLAVASLEILQMTALLLGPVHNIGNQNYHYVTGTLDRTDDTGCKATCLYPSLVAKGDSEYDLTDAYHRGAKQSSKALRGGS